MKFLLFVALLPFSSVVGLAPPKFVIKPRSVTSLETITGIKANVPRPRLQTKEPANTSDDSANPPLSSCTPFWMEDDTNYDEKYWYHPQIHTLGNIGVFGAIHAALAPLSTHIIDNVAYDGVDVRLMVAHELRQLVGKSHARVLDMCCGVGMSTRAMRQGFPDAADVIGVDTSINMVAMANFITTHLTIVVPLFQGIKTRVETIFALLQEQRQKMQHAKRSADGFHWHGIRFHKANAEKTNLPDRSFDVVTVMYAFHEAPSKGREQIMKEARRLLSPGGVLAIVDISSDYVPSPSMLAGEPYVIEYQKNFGNQLREVKGFLKPQYKTLIPGHVGMWTLKRSPNAV